MVGGACTHGGAEVMHAEVVCMDACMVAHGVVWCCVVRAWWVVHACMVVQRWLGRGVHGDAWWVVRGGTWWAVT